MLVAVPPTVIKDQERSKESISNTYLLPPSAVSNGALAV